MDFEFWILNFGLLTLWDRIVVIQRDFEHLEFCIIELILDDRCLMLDIMGLDHGSSKGFRTPFILN